jgi:hypothetical protein
MFDVMFIFTFQICIESMLALLRQRAARGS